MLAGKTAFVDACPLTPASFGREPPPAVAPARVAFATGRIRGPFGASGDPDLLLPVPVSYAETHCVIRPPSTVASVRISISKGRPVPGIGPSGVSSDPSKVPAERIVTAMPPSWSW